MWAIVGLGNPGTRYTYTRHNAGFWVIDKLFHKHNGSPNWKSKFSCDWQNLTILGERCLLIKPMKYMNLSGEACAPLLRFFKIDLDEVVVIHDELDLGPGRLQIKVGGGTGGHRGIADLGKHLGSGQFARIRLGIGRPRKETAPVDNKELASFDSAADGAGKQDVTSWVLGCPGRKDKELLNDAVSRSVMAVETILTKGIVAAQRDTNRKSRKASANKEKEAKPTILNLN